MRVRRSEVLMTVVLRGETWRVVDNLFRELHEGEASTERLYESQSCIRMRTSGIWGRVVKPYNCCIQCGYLYVE